MVQVDLFLGLPVPGLYDQVEVSGLDSSLRMSCCSLAECADWCNTMKLGSAYQAEADR